MVRLVPSTGNVTIPGIQVDAFLTLLPHLGLSLGSACNAGALEPSYVLTELGLSRDEAASSLGKGTTPEEVKMAVEDIVREVQELLALA